MGHHLLCPLKNYRVKKGLLVFNHVFVLFTSKFGCYKMLG